MSAKSLTTVQLPLIVPHVPSCTRLKNQNQPSISHFFKINSGRSSL